MRVDRRRAGTGVPQQDLDHPQVGAGFQQMGGKTMPQRVRRDRLVDALLSRPEFVEAIYRDLAWLGVEWEQPVLFQSARLPAYRTALDRLTGLGLTYPCTCTRRDITEAVAAPQEGVLPAGPCVPIATVLIFTPMRVSAWMAPPGP